MKQEQVNTYNKIVHRKRGLGDCQGIVILSKSYIAHVSTKKVLKPLSIYIYTEREVIESYEF